METQGMKTRRSQSYKKSSSCHPLESSMLKHGSITIPISLKLAERLTYPQLAFLKRKSMLLSKKWKRKTPTLTDSSLLERMPSGELQRKMKEHFLGLST
jgi:hypothetical protein